MRRVPRAHGSQVRLYQPKEEEEPCSCLSMDPRYLTMSYAEIYSSASYSMSRANGLMLCSLYVEPHAVQPHAVQPLTRGEGQQADEEAVEDRDTQWT